MGGIRVGHYSTRDLLDGPIRQRGDAPVTGSHPNRGEAPACSIMRRVLVIGSGGAGKSTFARSLAERLGLPLIHLDALYWRPGWVETPKEEWAREVRRLLSADRWVMDGNYGGTL